MNLSREEFQKQLLGSFKIEAEEHLQIILNGLLELEGIAPEKSPQETLDTIFREMHSLKGGARGVNLESIETICQVIEDVFSDLKNKKQFLFPQLFKALYEAIDLISASIANDQFIEQWRINTLIQDLKSSEKSIPTQKPTFTEVEVKTLPIKENTTIRVASLKLNHLLDQLEEMLFVKLTSRKKVSELELLKQELDQFLKKWNQMQVDVREIKEFLMRQNENLSESKEWTFFLQMIEFFNWTKEQNNTLEEKIEKLIQESLYEAHVMGGMVDNLIDSTKQILMQPFNTLLISLTKMARDLAVSLGKKIFVEIEGSEIEIDKRIHEELKDPLMHLIRNSIDHGIESPQERLALGKSEEGIIRISLERMSGARVAITVSDDGRGINIDKVKEALINLKKITKQELEALPEQELFNFIFLTSFSTAPKVTNLSGRGLGVRIVFEKIEKLGGKIEITSKQGKGTWFKIILPTKLATFRGVQVKSGDNYYIFPTQNVRHILRIKKSEIKTIEGKDTIQFNDKPVSFVRLDQILGFPYSDVYSKKIPVLIIVFAEIQVAVAVDAILNEQEFFVKTLGKSIKHLRNFAAVTIMDDGSIIPIIDSHDFVTTILTDEKLIPKIDKNLFIKSKEEKKVILVIEDSVLARMLLKNVLSSAGYAVKTAVDGIDAFTILKGEKIDLIMLDLEMPRLHGFELIKKLRQTSELKDIPIIICTNYGSEENQAKGIAMGASAFIIKKDFTPNQLINLVKQFL